MAARSPDRAGKPARVPRWGLYASARALRLQWTGATGADVGAGSREKGEARSTTTVAGVDPYPWKLVTVAFLAVAAVLTVVVTLANPYRRAPDLDPTLTGPAWLDGWFHYDAGWYLRIVTQGYDYVPGQQSSIAFFPVYPLTVRAVGTVLGDDQLAGTLVGVLAGLATALVFGRWAWDRLPRRSATLAIALLLVYPYAMFLYGAVYADSLFMLCTIGAFLLLDRRWYVAAGLVGALATAGRPVGTAVVVGLVVRTLEIVAQDRRTDPSLPVGWRDLVGALRHVRLPQLGVLLSVLGLALWSGYLWLAYGDPLAFVHVESAPGWDQGVGPHTWFKLGYVELVRDGHYRTAALLTLQAIVCVLAVLLLPRVWRLFGWGYLAYAAVVLLIPIVGTDDFMGTGRYALAAFPVVAAAGDFLAGLRSRALRTGVLALSGVLLVVLTVLFGISFEVS